MDFRQEQSTFQEYSEVNLPDDESPKFTLEVQGEKEERNKYGEKFEFDPAGPYSATRSRTDFCWLVGFLVYLMVWITVIVYAFSKGDMRKWMEPMDSNGLVCGKDPEVYDKPYLMHYNNGTCELPNCLVCVAACHKGQDFWYVMSSKEATSFSPGGSIERSKGAVDRTSLNESERMTTISPFDPDGITTTTTTTTIAPSSLQLARPEKTEYASREKREMAIVRENTVEETKKSIVCRAGVKMNLITSRKQFDYFVDKQMCSRHYFETTDADVKDRRCNVPEIDRWSKNDWRTTFVKVTKDLSAHKQTICGFIALTGALAILSIFLMRWYTFAFVCVSIFAFCALIFHYVYEECVLNASNKTNGILLSLFLCVLILVGIVLVVLYFRKEIYLACRMIEESVKAMTGVMASLLVPVVLFALYMLTLTLGVYVYLVLTTLESPIYRADFAEAEKENCTCPESLAYTQNATCAPALFDSECRTTDGARCVLSGCYVIGKSRRSVGFLHFINYLGLYWSFWFVLGLNDAILAGVYSTWYWTFNKKILSYLTVLESFWRIGLYHLGSIAIGSMIILVYSILRAIVNLVKLGLEKADTPFSRRVLLNGRGIFDLTEEFLNPIDRRAYVACALHGTDFLNSAKSAYHLRMRNAGRVLAVSEASSWITLLLAVVVSWLSTRIAVGVLESRDPGATSLPGLFVFIGSFLVSYMLLRTVSLAVDAVFHCFLEDTERNDGSYDRPYFGSDSLARFLRRK